MGRRSKKAKRELRLWDRRAQVLARVVAGLGVDTIAAEFEVSRQTISSDIRAALKRQEETMLTGAAEVRRVQQLRLTEAMDAIWLEVKGGDLDAIGIMLRLMKREAALLGLDAPTRIDVRRRIEERAAEQGWDADAAVSEFERIIAENA